MPVAAGNEHHKGEQTGDRRSRISVESRCRVPVDGLQGASTIPDGFGMGLGQCLIRGWYVSVSGQREQG